MKEVIFLLSAAFIMKYVESARILAVFPSASISHQVVFRPFVHELVSRGHEVVLITTDPAFTVESRPANLTEIDMHDISYKPWAEFLPAEYLDQMKPSVSFDMKRMTEMLTITFINMMELHLASEPVQKLINDKTQKFDLLLIEAYLRPALVYSHIFKAPVIQMSSFGSFPFNMETVGAVMHPILHPNFYTRKIQNRTPYERFKEIYHFFIGQYIAYSYEKEENRMLRRTVGPGIPTITELAENVDMLFLNIHPIWDFNRPVPPNVIFLGAMHIKPQQDLPNELKSYLDSSKNGIIYMSFGTNVDISMFPPGTINAFVKVFSELTYNVLWKWHTQDVPGLSKNVRISKWLPQRDLLTHPNVKLFITQGGLQSTDETILAGVPTVGIPMMGDQWYNVDLYVKHGIGVRLDIDSLNSKKFRNAIDTVINDKSYKENIIKLRRIMYDKPETSLERAVWWTEHVLRHGGARHLRAPAANMPWTQYYDVELVAYLLLGLLTVVSLITLVVYYCIKFILNNFFIKAKLKIN